MSVKIAFFNHAAQKIGVLILSYEVLCHMQREILAALESIEIYVPNAVRPAPRPSPLFHCSLCYKLLGRLTLIQFFFPELSVISFSCQVMSNHGCIPSRQLLRDIKTVLQLLTYSLCYSKLALHYQTEEKKKAQKKELKRINVSLAVTACIHAHW